MFSERRFAQVGFTLIEVLVSIAIITILIAAFSLLLVSLLKTNSRSAQQRGLNSDTQRYLEMLVADWEEPTHFAKGCVTSFSWPAGVTMTTEAFTLGFSPYAVKAMQPAGAAAIVPCDTTAPTRYPTIQRVTITVKVSGRSVTTQHDVRQP